MRGGGHIGPTPWTKSEYLFMYVILKLTFFVPPKILTCPVIIIFNFLVSRLISL